MKKVVIISFLIFAASIITRTYAQSGSYGTWTGIEVDKDYKKWGFSAETELRTIYYLRLIDRWSMGISADYSLTKGLKAGLGYELMSKLDYDPDYVKSYFIRNRFYGWATGKVKVNDFSLSLRERLQVTAKEDRQQTDGSIDDYKINPAWAWRNKLAVEYNIPKCKLTPSFSFETFYDLNNPDGNSFENLRYTLDFDYKLNKKNHVSIYGVVNSSLNSDDTDGKYILGLSYKHSL